MARWLLLALIAACGEAPPPTPPPAPVAERSDATPDLAVLERWLKDADRAPERVDDVLRVRHASPDGDVGIVVQPMPADHVVWLTTEPLVTLRDADGDRGVSLLLTNVAVLNYETLEGKLQLDPKTGGVLLSIELPTDDGLGKATFLDAVATIGRNAEALRPRLRSATSGRGL